ncbi:hypothetical protein E4T43_01502 [Aureobasidium subglaciale]|nr:hypothetical protein E4T43_01502 [Aureobasidium subglaciale]
MDVNFMAHFQHSHFRFIDCAALIEDGLIQILAYPELPEDYVAISYVWRGHRAAFEEPETNFIRVKGGEAADPINVDVLRSACQAAVSAGCNLLWLDQLCIMQTSKIDKVWQITNMYDIYQCCKRCIILPGGLSRLSTLFEPCPWMTRAWTLQEALAPPEVFVLFAWQLGDQSYQANTTIMIEQVEERKSATISLRSYMYATARYSDIANMSSNTSGGVSKSKLARTLLNAISFGSQDGPHRSLAILQSSFLRTSSRPVDMVLSIMGLFGVKLDPSAFAPEDRQRAMQDFLRICLQRGDSAYWLGINLERPGGSEISYLPPLPETIVDGAPQIRTVQGGLIESEEHMLGHAELLTNTPTGVIDASGILRLRTHSSIILYIMSFTKYIEIPEDFAQLGFLIDQADQDTNYRLWKTVHDRGMSGKRSRKIRAQIKSSFTQELQDLIVVEEQRCKVFQAVHVGERHYLGPGEYPTMCYREPNVFFLVQRDANDKNHTWKKIGYGEVSKAVLKRWRFADILLR